MESRYFIERSRYNLKLSQLIFIFLVFSLLFSTFLEAKPVSVKQAEKTVKGWLKRNPKPLNMELRTHIKRSEVFSGKIKGVLLVPHLLRSVRQYIFLNPPDSFCTAI